MNDIDKRHAMVVVQLGTLGEAIQSTPALQELAAAFPGGNLDLIVRAGHEEALAGLPGVRQVRAAGLPEAGLSAYGRVINLTDLTCSDYSAPGDWPSYLVATGLFRQQNHFNRVDVYRGIGRGVAAGLVVPQPGSRPYVALARDAGVPLPEGRRVAVHPGPGSWPGPGPGEPEHSWPAARFAQLVDGLRDRGLVPILVGSPADRAICAEVAAACVRPPPDLSGRTSAPQLARLLSQVDLLISHEAAAVHLAAAVGTRVLGLYGVTSYFAESAPWGEGHLVLQTPLGQEGQCLQQLEPDLVVAAALNCLCMGLSSADRGALVEGLADGSVSAWETRFLPAGADPLGGLCYVPLHRLRLGYEDLFTRVLRHVLAWEFCGVPGGLSVDHLLALLSAPEVQLAPDVERSRFKLGLVVTECTRRLQAMSVSAADARKLLAGQEGALLDATHERLIAELAGLRQAAAAHPILAPVVGHLDRKLDAPAPVPLQETLARFQTECRRAREILMHALLLMERLFAAGIPWPLARIGRTPDQPLPSLYE